MNSFIEKYGAGPIFIVGSILVGILAIGGLVALRGDDATSVEQEYIDIANQVGLNQEQFLTDFRGEEVKQIVEDQKNDALIRLNGNAATPSIFLDGERAEIADFSTYKAVLQPMVNALEEGGKVKMEIFEDYNCPSCANFYPISYQLKAEFGDKLDLQHKNLPFLKPTSTSYARAAEAARKQDKIYEYSRALFEKIHGKQYVELDGLQISE